MSHDELNRRLRLQLYFEEQDAFFPYASWPGWVQRDILIKHKRTEQRYRVFLFLVYNGLPPHVALEWVAAQDIDIRGNVRMLRKLANIHSTGNLIQGEYDASAVRHFKQLVRNAESGILQRQAKAIFNMHTRRVENPTARMLERRPGFYNNNR